MSKFLHTNKKDGAKAIAIPRFFFPKTADQKNAGHQYFLCFPQYFLLIPNQILIVESFSFSFFCSLQTPSILDMPKILSFG